MKKILISSLMIIFLLACANQTQSNSLQSSSIQEDSQSNQDNSTAESNVAIRKRICSVPPAPQNIWKLEPMLKQTGQIKDGMTKQQKEQIIRDYIHKKNSAYTQCIKGK